MIYCTGEKRCCHAYSPSWLISLPCVVAMDHRLGIEPKEAVRIRVITHLAQS